MLPRASAHTQSSQSVRTDNTFSTNQHKTYIFSKLSTFDRRKIYQSKNTKLPLPDLSFSTHNGQVNTRTIARVYPSYKNFESDPTLKALFNSQCPCCDAVGSFPPKTVPSFVISHHARSSLSPSVFLQDPALLFFWQKALAFRSPKTYFQKPISISVSLSRTQFSVSANGRKTKPKTLKAFEHLRSGKQIQKRFRNSQVFLKR